MKAIVVAGGTLGHVKPAIEIARELKNRNVEVLIISDNAEFLRGENLIYYIIKPSYFKKFFSFRTLKFPFSQTISLLKALQLIEKNRVSFVVGMGSYVSLPVVLAAKIKRRSIYLCEQNVIPGKANLFLSRYAKAVFVSFEETRKYFSRSYNFGNPISKEFFRAKLKSKGKFTLLVFGGTNGAHDINEKISNSASYFKKNGLKLIHITGWSDYGLVKKRYDEEGLSAEVLPFAKNMLDLYRRADLVVCRAGSSTLFELSALKIPAIIVPHPFTVNNHQKFNAEVSKNIGFVVLQNCDLNLIEKIEDFRKGRLKMNIKSISNCDSARKIVDKILENEN